MRLTSKWASPDVGIVGGTGGMGAWFGDLLERLGSRVFRVGRATALTPADVARRCDVVVISVPIAETLKVIQELGPLISEDALLMDLTSVKRKPMEAMLKYSRSEVVGAHPLFGPHVKCSPELRVVLCPGRGETGLAWVQAIFQVAGLGVTVISSRKHDYIMGLVQGVNHFSTLALALCISRSGLEAQDLLGCSTQTFKQRLKRIDKIMEENAELFRSLLMDNPPAEEFMVRYLDAAEELFKVIREKDTKAFETIFASLGEYFGSPGKTPRAI